jgi:hypothetical protein
MLKKVKNIFEKTPMITQGTHQKSSMSYKEIKAQMLWVMKVIFKFCIVMFMLPR